jgi:NitT/TauT family transport system substrate-binding protein
MRWRHGFVLFIFFGVLLLAWGLCATETSLLLPSPLAVFKRVVFQFERLVFHSFSTFKMMVMAVFLAIGAALPFSWLMTKKPWTRPIIQSFFVVFQCLPMFTLAPLMILWFGWSTTAVLVPTTLMILFPLIVNFYKGMTATPQEYLDFFETHEASEWQTWHHLRLPFALPYVFSGLRISVSFAGIGAIAGEWAGAQKGLGVFLQECRRNFDIEGLFAGLFCLLALTLFLYGSIFFIESLWRKERRYAAY